MNIPVELSRILITELGEQQVIFLRETEGERTFPIMIGLNEALAIDRRLKGIPTPRPMTHDLLAGVITSLHATVEKIVVNDLRDHTFYATLYLRTRDGRMVEVDSRPSDAIALGAALSTPMYVADHVIDAVTSQEPGTREERLALLRDRRDALAKQIAILERMLNDEDFLENTPKKIVLAHRKQLEAMQTEHDAIEEFLRKMD